MGHILAETLYHPISPNPSLSHPQFIIYVIRVLLLQFDISVAQVS